MGAVEVGTSDLIPRMWKAVDAADDAKYIRWVRQDGKIYLEVVSRKSSEPLVGGTSMEAHGSCDWDGYWSFNSGLAMK